VTERFGRETFYAGFAKELENVQEQAFVKLLGLWLVCGETSLLEYRLHVSPERTRLGLASAPFEAADKTG
jgi:hypothetical protein